jgi:hypothetical protein
MASYKKIANLKGPQGIQGIQGAQGLKGDKGDRGPSGPSGAGGLTTDAAVAANIESAATQTNAKAKALVTSMVDGVYGALGSTNKWAGKQLFGLGIATPRPRQPFASSQIVKASDAGTADHVSHLIETRVSGDWTADTGPNARKVWGMNAFTVTGNQSGDANGVDTLYGGLIEADIAAPAGTEIVLAIGLQVEASFFGAQAGAHVGQMRSLNVAAPVRKDGATGGTTDIAIGLRVEAVAAAAAGATQAFSMWVDGGLSRIYGRTEHIAKAATDQPLTIVGVSGQTAPLFLINDGNGNRVIRVNAADGSMTAVGPLIARENATSQVKLGAFGPAAEPAVALGDGTPSVLYKDATGKLRSAAEIRSDAALSTSGKVYSGGLLNVSDGTKQIVWGNGAPAISAGVGSIYLRMDGGANTTLYIKESGTGSTGWVAK